MGRKKEIPKGIDPDKLVLIGDCLKMHHKKGIFVEGCPPGEPVPHWAIVERGLPDLSNPRERMDKETPQIMAHVRRLKALWDKSQAGK